jgi:hypothetical protein
MIDWKKSVRFKIGDLPWEVPLNIFVLLIVITLALMIGGAYLGFQFGSGSAN